MDFASPEAVTNALQQRATHPIYGYTQYPETALQAVMDWLKKRYGWKVQRDGSSWCPELFLRCLPASGHSPGKARASSFSRRCIFRFLGSDHQYSAAP